MKNKGLLSYDIESTPSGINAERLVNIMNDFSIVFWDSTKGGNAPTYIDEVEDGRIIIDSSTEDGARKLKEINDKFNND